MKLDSQAILAGTINASGVLAGQAITATTVGSNAIDLGVARDLGTAQDLFANYIVTAAFNNLTSLELQLISASNENLTTGQLIVASSGAVPLAQLVAGFQFSLAVPRHANNGAPRGQRYLGARFVVVGTAPSTGQVFAALQLGVQDKFPALYYPDGVDII